SGHHGGAHAEAIHRFAAQRSDGELVHIAGDDDLRVVRAQGIKLVADLLSEYTEVARVDAHPAEFRAGHANGGLHALGDVVGVHQQGGAHTVGGDLCAEGSFLIGSAVWVGVQQRPGVGSGAGCWDVVAERRLKVGGGVETCEVGGTGARYRGVFVRAAAAHLDDGAAVGSGDHAGSRGGHGGVRVEDG